MRLPGSVMRNLIIITIKGEFLDLSFHFTPSSNRFVKLRYQYTLKDFIYGCKLKIKRDIIFDASLYSEDFHVKVDGLFVHNQDLIKILNVNLGSVENLDIIVPNKFKITSGKYKIDLRTETPKFRYVFKADVSTSTDEIEFPPEQQIEKILQQSESVAYNQQDAREFQSKIVKRGFQIVLLIYLPVVLIFFGITLFLLLDPAASQTDAGLGPFITLIFLIFVGLCFLPNFKRRILGRKKEE